MGEEPAQTSPPLFFKGAMPAGSLHRSYATPCRRHPSRPLPSFSPHVFAAVGLPPARAPSLREGPAGSPADPRCSEVLAWDGMGGRPDGGWAAATRKRSSRVFDEAFPRFTSWQIYHIIKLIVYLQFSGDLFDIHYLTVTFFSKIVMDTPSSGCLI